MFFMYANAQQEKQIYQYKNIKKKLYKTNAAIWYNKTRRHKQLPPNFILIKINSNNRRCLKINAGETYRIKLHVQNVSLMMDL